MSRATLAVLLALASATSSFAGPADWTGAPMGIRITEITALADGIGVRFETDLPPPYRIGLHIPEEVGSSVRAWPVAYTDVTASNEYYAVVRGRFLDVALFVQVYKPGPRTTPYWTHLVMDDDWRAYVARVRARPPRSLRDPGYYGDPRDRDLGGVDPQQFTLVGDETWGCFIATNATELSLTAQEITRIPGPVYCLSTNSVPIRATGLDPSLGGSGYRVLVFTGGTGRETLVQNAYSVRTDMSQEVLVKRGWKSLSSNGEWKFATDWEGSRVFVPCTNAVPYRIYGSGL